MAVANSISILKRKDFEACLANQLSLGLVLRDSSAGTANQVKATPSFFINGKLQVGIRDAESLRGLIDSAIRDISPARTVGTR